MKRSPWPIGPTTQVIRRPRCPVCGSTNVETYSSRPKDGGGQTRYCRCRDCRDMQTREPTRFKVFVY